MEGIIGTLNIGCEKVILRYPKLSDYKQIWKFYNKAIKESLAGGGFLSRIRPVNLKEEKEWVKSAIEKTKKKKSIYMIAECNGRVIGATDVNKAPEDALAHTGTFGIAILEEFAGRGLGTRMMEKIINLAKSRLNIEIVKLSVFSNNKRAQGLYSKMRFVECGRISKGRKIKGKYGDEIIMVKYL